MLHLQLLICSGFGTELQHGEVSAARWEDTQGQLWAKGSHQVSTVGSKVAQSFRNSYNEVAAAWRPSFVDTRQVWLKVWVCCGYKKLCWQMWRRGMKCNQGITENRVLHTCFITVWFWGWDNGPGCILRISLSCVIHLPLAIYLAQCLAPC